MSRMFGCEVVKLIALVLLADNFRGVSQTVWVFHHSREGHTAKHLHFGCHFQPKTSGKNPWWQTWKRRPIRLELQLVFDRWYQTCDPFCPKYPDPSKLAILRTPLFFAGSNPSIRGSDDPFRVEKKGSFPGTVVFWPSISGHRKDLSLGLVVFFWGGVGLIGVVGLNGGERLVFFCRRFFIIYKHFFWIL